VSLRHCQDGVLHFTPPLCGSVLRLAPRGRDCSAHCTSGLGMPAGRHGFSAVPVGEKWRQLSGGVAESLTWGPHSAPSESSSTSYSREEVECSSRVSSDCCQMASACCGCCCLGAFTLSESVAGSCGRYLGCSRRERHASGAAVLARRTPPAPAPLLRRPSPWGAAGGGTSQEQLLHGAPR